MYKHIFKFRAILMGLFLFIFCLGINSASSAPSLAASLAGRILLQVEANGEAWYVMPKEKEMVYMKDGAVAYQIMRELSLGITDLNLAKIPVGIEARFNDNDTDGDGLSDRLEEGLGTNLNKADTDGDGFNDGQEIKSNYNPLNKNKLVYDQALANRLKGYILLQTEKQGQAWYLNPKDGKRYYMKDGAAAYNIMRFLSLGITNKNLALIPKSSRTFKVDTSGGNSSNQGNQGNNNSTSTPPSTPPNTPPGGGGGGSNPPTPNNDQDNDGYKINGNSPLDCNDNNPSINPGATEICGNNIDEDCSGADLQCVVPDYDVDNDGYDSMASGGTDCNDNNADVNPGETEISRNNIDDNCNGQTDEVVIIPGADDQVPTVPTNLAGTLSGTQVVLTWTQSSDNIGVYQYDVERRIGASGTFQNIAAVNATTYTNINLSYSTSYFYRIKARDVAGNSSLYSNQFTITTSAEPDTTPPNAPTGLTGIASTNQVSLSWTTATDNIGVTQYHVEMSTSTSNFAQIAIVSNTSYTNINLNPGTTYYYRVRARDAALWYSSFSQVFSITTLAVVVPPSGSVSISGVSGTMSAGQTVTISGSGFGTKAQANPLVWDNFEDGTVGSSIRNTSPIIGPAWSVWTNGTDPVYGNNFNRTNSSKNALFDFSGSTGYTKFLQYYTTVDSAYFTFWWRYNKTSTEWSANIKPWDEFGNGSSGICPSIYSGYGSPTNSDGYLRASVTDCGGGTGQQLNSDMFSWLSYDSPIDEIQGQWVRMEMYVKQSSAPNVADGVYKMWVHKPDGEGITLDISSNNVITRNTMDEWYQWWLLGAYHTMDDRSPSATGQIFGDDVYFDSSQARIELGNASTWVANTHREIQIPTSWSNGSLSFTVNPGTFTSGQTAYLYIVDNNGSVNANGYPITIAGTSVVDQTAPSNPSNLTASISGTQASLSWNASTDNVGVVGYQIWRSTTNGGPYTTQVSTSNTNSYTHTLTAGTYYYVVKAYDAAGLVSGNSNQVTVTITSQADQTAPTAPSNLTATVSGTQSAFSWAASTDATGVTGYQILRSSSNGGPYILVTTSNTTSYTHTGLTAGTYYYIVKAYDAAGNVSGNSNQVTVTVSNIIITTTNLIQNSWDFSSSVWDGDATGSNPWSPKTNFTFTSGQSDPFNTNKAFKIALSTSNTRQYQQRDSTPNLVLNYDNVVASFYVKYGNTSNIVFGLNDTTTNTEYEQLFTFSNGVPAYSGGTNDGTTVTNVGSGWYRISMRLALLSRGIKGHSFKARVTPAGSSATIGAYSYVTGFQLESGTSATAYVETPSGSSDQTAPSNPSNLTASISGTQASLSWNASTDNVGVVGYQIWRSTTNGGPYTTQVSTSNTNSYTHTLTAGTYYYVVKAYDAAGLVSGNSNQVTVTITSQADQTAPTAPSNLTATVSGTQISLNWTASSDNVGVSQYRIETANGGNYSPAGTSNSTVYTVSNLAANTTYSCRVQAQDAAGNMSLYSNIATVTTGGTPPSGSISITGISGTMSQGQTVTISGSGFGTKNRQQPLLFDDISSITGYQAYLQNNTIVPTRGCAFGATNCEANPQPTNQSLPWYNHWYGGTPRFYIGTNNRYPAHPAYRATNLADSFSRNGYFARDFAINTSEGWSTLDWWIRSSHDFGQNVSGKILRLWHNPNVVDQVVVADISGAQLVTEMHGCGYDSSIPNYFTDFSIGQWFHVQVLTHVSPSENKARVLVDGELVASSTDVCGIDGIYDYLRMVGLDPSIPENLNANMEFLWGDIYFDDSLARVVLSDSPSFNPFGGTSNTHYELQNIQSWSSNSVSLKFNPGSFTSGQTAYLYVVDSNGNVNSSGYPVTISGVLGTSINSCSNPDQDTVNWTQIPNGALVRGCGSAIYVIQNNERIHIASLDVLRNQYPGQRIYNVSESLLGSYPIVYR